MPPSAPEGLLGLVDGSSLSLAWRNTFTGGAASGIILEVAGTIATSLTLPPSETFTFAGVPPGTYTLSVRASNAFGTSTASNPVTLTFPNACSGVPLAPENVLVYKAGTRLSVYWNPAGGGPAPTGFVLLVTGTLTGNFATTGRTLSGAVGPGTYSLSVAATNACGQSAASAAQVVTVP
jgi:predicted phage tail protein